MDDLVAIPAAAVSAASGRIRDALSTYRDGEISGVNETARRLGVTVGMKAADTALAMLQARLPKAVIGV